MATLAINYETGYDSDSPIGDLGSAEYNLAQSFTTVGAITVPFVDIYVKKVASITDPITVRLETNSAGVPSGTLVDASATTTITPTSTSYDWIRATFPAGISLSATTLYHIKCTVPASQATGDRYDWARQSTGNGYAGGEQSVQTNLGAWTAATGADCYFRVYEGVDSGGYIFMSY